MIESAIRPAMDILVRCVLFFLVSNLFLTTITTTRNADVDSPLGHRTAWPQRLPIGSILKASGNCKFSLAIKDTPKHLEQKFEMNSKEMDRLVDRRNTANDSLYLPHRLISLYHAGIPECPTQIIIDEKAIYKLEQLILTNLPQLPDNVGTLRLLKKFLCKKIYSAPVDIAVLANMTQLANIFVHQSVGVTASQSLRLPSLGMLTIESSTMISFNNVVCDFPNLSSLRLENVGLEAIPSYFSTFKKLTLAEIKQNKLKRITFDVFNHLNELDQLILIRNQLSEIVTENRVELLRLTILNLSENNLTFLNVTLWSTPSLRMLMLANNRLKQVPGLLTLFSSGKLHYLIVRENSWDCGWLKQTIASIPDATIDVPIKNVCAVNTIKTPRKE